MAKAAQEVRVGAAVYSMQQRMPVIVSQRVLAATKELKSLCKDSKKDRDWLPCQNPRELGYLAQFGGALPVAGGQGNAVFGPVRRSLLERFRSSICANSLVPRRKQKTHRCFLNRAPISPLGMVFNLTSLFCVTDCENRPEQGARQSRHDLYRVSELF